MTVLFCLAPYLLSELHFSYVEFMLLIGAALAGKMWGMSLWGRFAQRWGAQRLLRIGGLGIIPFSALWILSHEFWYLFALQVLAGLVWSAYELATMLLFFETIPRHERTGLLTIYNVTNAVALATGSVLGGGLLRSLGQGSQAAPVLTGISPYAVLFGCSALFRLLSLPLLFRVPDVRSLATTPARPRLPRPSGGTPCTEQPELSAVSHGHRQAA